MNTTEQETKENTGFINEPKTKEDFVHNAQFQFENLDGFMYIQKYELALVKAECLVRALKLVIAQTKPKTK